MRIIGRLFIVEVNGLCNITPDIEFIETIFGCSQPDVFTIRSNDAADLVLCLGVFKGKIPERKQVQVQLIQAILCSAPKDIGLIDKNFVNGIIAEALAAAQLINEKEANYAMER